MRRGTTWGVVLLASLLGACGRGGPGGNLASPGEVAAPRPDLSGIGAEDGGPPSDTPGGHEDAGDDGAAPGADGTAEPEADAGAPDAAGDALGDLADGDVAGESDVGLPDAAEDASTDGIGPEVDAADAETSLADGEPELPLVDVPAADGGDAADAGPGDAPSDGGVPVDGAPCDTDADCPAPGPPGGCERARCQEGTCVVEAKPAGTACSVLPESVAAECVQARCDQAGSCVAEPLPGTDCDDGNPCTEGDVCTAEGTCEGASAVVCEADDPCRVASCDPEAGGCVTEPAEDGTPCDDGDACTAETVCEDGTCQGGDNVCPCDGPEDCPDDGNPCTGTRTCQELPEGGTGCVTDPDSVVTCEPAEDPCLERSCDPETGSCVAEPLPGTPCDDGNPCTDDDVCDDEGTCSGTPASCDDGDPCTADSCDPATGACEHEPISGASCDDGDPCTIDDVCDEGVCEGTPKSCDDGNACTEDACDPATGACVFEPISGASCDDGSACTTDDTCESGICVGAPVDCDDGNPCTTDTCLPEQGCVHADNQELCDDGDPCTEADQCEDGSCEGEPRSCDDGVACTVDGCDAEAGGCTHEPDDAACDDDNPCTEDICDPETGCRHEPKPGPCDDGSACTTNDACQDGTCIGEPIDCSDGIACTIDQCDPDEGCTYEADDAACDDGNPCTEDACDPAQSPSGAGGCVHQDLDGAPCDDGDPCTVDDVCQSGSCEPGPNECECQEDADCDDGNPCNGVFACQEQDDGTTACVQTSEPVVCDGEAAGPCLKRVCDPDSGSCVDAPVEDGTPCPDDDPCTVNETCHDGVCEYEQKACDDGVACTTDGCDPASGCIHTPDDGACDDGLACTSDQCSSSEGCLHQPDDGACDDGLACTTDACDPDEGCVHEPDDGACDDGLACTVDVCDGSEGCLHEPDDEACDDGNPCTADTCDPDEGCVHEPVSGSCEDGNLCTVDDQCQDGTCEPGSPKDCSDGNPCTADECTPSTGECANPPRPDGTDCEDGDACTEPDRCEDGECVSGPDKSCDDGLACTQDGCDGDTGCFHEPDDGACDDGNPCTIDTCDVSEGCVHEPRTNFAACDDGQSGTGPDVCIEGVCRGFQTTRHELESSFVCPVETAFAPELGVREGSFLAVVDAIRGGADLPGCDPGRRGGVVRMDGAESPALLEGSVVVGRYLGGLSHDLVVGETGDVGRIFPAAGVVYEDNDVNEALEEIGLGSATWSDVWATPLRNDDGSIFEERYYLAGRGDSGEDGGTPARLVRCVREPQSEVSCLRLAAGLGAPTWTDLHPGGADGHVDRVGSCTDCQDEFVGTSAVSEGDDGSADGLLSGDAADVYDLVSPPTKATLRDSAVFGASERWVVGDGGLIARYDGTEWQQAAVPDALGDASFRGVGRVHGSVVVAGYATGDSPEARLLALTPGADPTLEASWRVVALGADREAWDVRATGSTLHLSGRETDVEPNRRPFFWYLPL